MSLFARWARLPDGLLITSAVSDYFPRMVLSKPQPPAITVEYDLRHIRSILFGTIKRMMAVITEFRASGGDVEILPTDSKSEMCSARLWPAHNTDLCKAWGH